MQDFDGLVDRQKDFARDEGGGAAIENALLLSLIATLVYIMKSTAIGPMLQRFVEAANTISRALG